jgi:hypothetical protein
LSPSASIAVTSRRHGVGRGDEWFVGESVELDALPPRVLRDMVRDVIEQDISPEATRALRMLFDEYQRGSSLDEIVLGQMWCAGLFQARPEDFVGNDHANEPCRSGLKARIEIRHENPNPPELLLFSCAHPQHEVLEAFRWYPPRFFIASATNKRSRMKCANGLPASFQSHRHLQGAAPGDPHGIRRGVRGGGQPARQQADHPHPGGRQHEREAISERTKAAIAATKARGKRWARADPAGAVQGMRAAARPKRHNLRLLLASPLNANGWRPDHAS